MKILAPKLPQFLRRKKPTSGRYAPRRVFRMFTRLNDGRFLIAGFVYRYRIGGRYKP